MASEKKKTHTPLVSLTSSQKKKLRGLAHSLKPVVQVGQEGVTSGIVQAAQSALQTHELIKIQLAGHSDASAKSEACRHLDAELGNRTHLVGRIGRMAIFYFEKDPQEAQIKL